MPTATFVHQGDEIDYTPASDVAAGDVVLHNELIAIAKRPIKAGERGSLSVRGVFLLPKEVPAFVDIGHKLYWNVAGGYVDVSNGGGTHKLLGKAVESASLDTPTVHVMLTQ